MINTKKLENLISLITTTCAYALREARRAVKAEDPSPTLPSLVRLADTASKSAAAVDRVAKAALTIDRLPQTPGDGEPDPLNRLEANRLHDLLSFANMDELLDGRTYDDLAEWEKEEFDEMVKEQENDENR